MALLLEDLLEFINTLLCQRSLEMRSLRFRISEESSGMRTACPDKTEPAK